MTWRSAPSSPHRKSRCHHERRNSPSVIDLRPTSSCFAMTFSISRSSTALSASAPISPRWRCSRACLTGAERSRLPTWSARNGGLVRCMRIFLTTRFEEIGEGHGLAARSTSPHRGEVGAKRRVRGRSPIASRRRTRSPPTLSPMGRGSAHACGKRAHPCQRPTSPPRSPRSSRASPIARPRRGYCLPRSRRSRTAD